MLCHRPLRRNRAGYEPPRRDLEPGRWARYRYADGDRGGEGYLGTELWRDVGGDPLRYLVLDRWRTASDYADFLAANEDEYRRRGRDAQRLWLSESVVGRFVRL